MDNNVAALFTVPVTVNGNFISVGTEQDIADHNQNQTKEIFSDKWTEAESYENIEKLYHTQYEWFLSLYGFETEDALSKYLLTKKYIIDTGTGLGYKAAWFARLAPHATVIGMDISDAADIAARKWKLPNLFFIRGDIADTKLKLGSMDFVVCDQVIMHTENPEATFKHLSDITKHGGEFACYVYSKKSIPRELVDDYFRKETHDISNEEMWEFSKQLTELGKRLSELKVNFESPDIPLLGIKGGVYDIQRFIHWNFIKCFWKEDWGFDLSTSTNYDWYAPSNAKRFTKEEFLGMAGENKLETSFLHEEEACYSARFLKPVK